MMPAAGSMERYRLLEWMNFLATEVHKQNTPLFKPNTPEDYKPIAKEVLSKSYALLDKHLAGKQFMLGDRYSIADPYLFVMANWLRFHQIDVAQWPNVKALAGTRARSPEGAGGDEGGRADQVTGEVISSPARSSP